MAKRHPALIPLSSDHHHALALALRCRKHALGQMNPGNSQALAVQAEEVQLFFHKSLCVHFEAEEKILFPLIIATCPDAEPSVARLTGEHQQLYREAAQLRDEARISKTLFNLGDLLESHIRFEERELFPLFESTVPEESAVTAGQEIQEILRGVTESND